MPHHVANNVMPDQGLHCMKIQKLLEEFILKYNEKKPEAQENKLGRDQNVKINKKRNGKQIKVEWSLVNSKHGNSNNLLKS